MMSVSNFANYILKFPNDSQGSFDDASNMSRLKIQKNKPQMGLEISKKVGFFF